MVALDWVHTIVGIFILAGLALGTWVHPYWYWFIAFIGIEMVQFGFSRFCLIEKTLIKMGVPEKK